MKTWIAAIAVVLSGCAHLRHHADNPNLPHPDTVIPAESSATGVTPLPAQYEDYYVGMIADADDANFAYRPGDLIVQTRPDRFRLDHNSAEITYAPAQIAGMVNDHPEPTATEVAAMAMHSQRMISALSEEIDRLRKPETSVPLPTDSTEGATPAAASPPSGARQNASEHFTIIGPDAENTIALDPNLFARDQPRTDNPFVQIYQPPIAWRNLEILVSAAVPGPNPSVIIDNEPYATGDTFKDLAVYRIESDRVYLRKDTFLLECPVSDRVLKLRLP